MKVNIHNNQMKVIDFMDNDVPGSLKYSNEDYGEYLEGGSETFDFTVDKFLKGKIHPRYENLSDASFFSFTEGDQIHLFSVINVTEDDYKCTFECELSISELLTEVLPKFTAKEPYTFDEYVSMMNLTDSSRVSIGVNNIDKKKKLILEFGDNDTLIKRFQNLVTEFDGELKFSTDVHNDGSIDEIRVDVFRARNLTTGADGVGSDRKDIYLEFGRSLNGITVNTSRENQFTAIRLKDKNGKYFIPDKNIILKNAEGQNEFFMMRNSHTMYAPLAMLQYPSLSKRDECDNWVVKEFTCDFTKKSDLQKYITTLIKTYAYPRREYEVDVDGFEVLRDKRISLGDTIYLRDPNFMGGSLFSARITEIHKCWTNPLNNKITLSNVQKLATKISDTTQAVMAKLIAENVPYKIDVLTTNGTVFKDESGTSKILLDCLRGTEKVNPTEVVYEIIKEGQEGNPEYVDKEYTVRAIDFEKTLKVKINVIHVLSDNKVVSSTELTFTNVKDGISPITLTIESSNGDTFKNSVIETILRARLWQDGKEIDENGTKFKYIWTKKNQNGVLDITWNNRYKTSRKEVPVSTADVDTKAIFECQVETIE